MARPPSPTSRTSLYRLKNLPDLSDGIRESYRTSDNFQVTDLNIQGRDALLVRGAMETPTVSWASTLHGLTDQIIDLGNSTAAAVLLLRGQANSQHSGEAVGSSEPGYATNGRAESDDSDADDVGQGREVEEKHHTETKLSENEDDSRTVAWALTYGMGFQLLEMAKVDSGFGQRIALRTADPRELRSVTRTMLDQRARTERASIPAGDSLRGFGAGAFGELVTRLVAKANASTLTGGAKPIRIRGADALSAPLGKKPGELVKDLDELAKILRQPVPNKELALLEQLVTVKDPEVLRLLEASLAEALVDPTFYRLGLSWPHERIDENGTVSSFKIYGGGREFTGARDGEPDFDAVLAPLRQVDTDDLVERLRKMRVQLFSDADGEDRVSAAIPAIRWLTYEIDRDGKRYCLHDGSWYLMNQDYAERLRVQVQEIFDREPSAELPEWPSNTDEKAYNELAARAVGGICLDRRLIRTEAHGSGIEVCDLLLPNGTPVHVKELSGSAAASHLLAQALVSTESLLLDQDARDQFNGRVRQAGMNPDQLPPRPEQVILGVARKGKRVRASDLFTFTQVTLVRQAQILGVLGVKVVIAPIPRPETTAPD